MKNSEEKDIKNSLLCWLHCVKKPRGKKRLPAYVERRVFEQLLLALLCWIYSLCRAYLESKQCVIKDHWDRSSWRHLEFNALIDSATLKFQVFEVMVFRYSTSSRAFGFWPQDVSGACGLVRWDWPNYVSPLYWVNFLISLLTRCWGEHLVWDGCRRWTWVVCNYLTHPYFSLMSQIYFMAGGHKFNTQSQPRSTFNGDSVPSFLFSFFTAPSFRWRFQPLFCFSSLSNDGGWHAFEHGWLWR